MSLGGFHPGKDPTLAAALSYFGRPSRLTGGSMYCSGRWGGLALTIYFANYSGTPGSCNPPALLTQTVRIQGRYAKRWRTTRGLRVGDSTRRVRRLYGRAQRHGGSYWLVWHRDFYAVPEIAYASVLEALARHGRVYAFRLREGAAGD